jgi:hypothetical protein
MIDSETRQYVAVLARRHFAGTVTLDTLFEQFGASDDPLIRALLEAAVHQPRRGFAGISQEQWEREFWVPVSGLLAELEKGLDGRAPTRRIYPRGSLVSVFGWLAFSLFAGAHAAEQAGRIWKIFSGGATLPTWGVILEAVGLAVTGIATGVGVRAALFRLYLFRTRNRPYSDREERAG